MVEFNVGDRVQLIGESDIEYDVISIDGVLAWLIKTEKGTMFPVELSRLRHVKNHPHRAAWKQIEELLVEQYRHENEMAETMLKMANAAATRRNQIAERLDALRREHMPKE